MKNNKSIIEVVPTGERVSLAFNSTNHLEAQVTYNSYVSKDTVFWIKDDALLTQVAFMQSAANTVTIERISMTEPTEELLVEVMDKLTEHLVEKGIKNTLIFIGSDEVDSYIKLGFTPVIYVEDVSKWLFKKDISELSMIIEEK